MEIDEMIKTTKLCTKALMKLSFKDFKRNENFVEDKISNKNKMKNNY